jgi:hypothetical protein
MDPSGKRVIGSLILLLGLTFLAIGIVSGQLNYILDFLKKVFEPSIAGAP